LAEHNGSLEFSKDGGASERLDDFTGNDVDDEDVTDRAAKDGDELRILDNHHARLLAREDAENLRRHAHGRDQDLQQQSESRANFLDRPAREEQIQSS
jgi:hypothetical protein